ncbi:indole-3-glycerol phosphate synthase TrpC [Oceanobacillus massiliensis]|uniref:indole-3-glycerol phosphate synthase TrpC n=1 Tax=Oceanobacillus massiliensis TaxID=1465765 RepID=UPI00028A0719|nr:indole-3-glycerol phosphate synthase TrpC [Oceanobacillus massiliensis]
MTFLEKILAEKAKEVSSLKQEPVHERPNKNVPTFKERIAASSTMNIIAEIKRSSPSKGAIQMDVDPIEQARQYQQAGAAAISVLTDRPFFNGSLDDLRAVRDVVDIPILCKDFIIDPIQIDHAHASGANIILLIVAALSDEEFKRLYEYAKKLDLEVLCEVHNKEEMTRALDVKPEIIGINNRNLKTFDVDLRTTEQLSSLVQDYNITLISESGMKTKQDVQRAAAAGAEAVLVGETLMKADNLKDAFLQFQVPLPVKGVR